MISVGELWVDEKHSLSAASISGEPVSLFGKEPDDIRIPMPDAPALLIVEQAMDGAGGYEFHLYKAVCDWQKALAAMAGTPCWVQEKGRLRQIPCQQGELAGKRGEIMMFLAYVAPGGRVFYGSNASAITFTKPSSSGAPERYLISWGHGVVPVEKATNDNSLVISVLLGNCIGTRAQLIGVHHVDPAAKGAVGLNLVAPATSDIAEKSAKSSPLPGR